MPEGVLTSFTVCEVYCYFVNNVKNTSEYLLQTDNNIVIGWYFTFIKNLILVTGFNTIF